LAICLTTEPMPRRRPMYTSLLAETLTVLKHKQDWHATCRQIPLNVDSWHEDKDHRERSDYQHIPIV